MPLRSPPPPSPLRARDPLPPPPRAADKKQKKPRPDLLPSRLPGSPPGPASQSVFETNTPRRTGAGITKEPSPLVRQGSRGSMGSGEKRGAGAALPAASKIAEEEWAALFRNNLLRSCWKPGLTADEVQSVLSM